MVSLQEYGDDAYVGSRLLSLTGVSSGQGNDKRCEQLNVVQLSLLEETMDENLAALEEELEAFRDAPAPQPSRPRLWLPAKLPCVDIHHEPALCLSQGRADPLANTAQSRDHWISTD